MYSGNESEDHESDKPFGTLGNLDHVLLERSNELKWEDDLT